MRSLSSSAPSSLPLRSSPPFPHSSLRWGSPPPPLQPRSFSSGFASKRSAATFGAAKLRRVSSLLPRRCRRVAGPASAGWLQRALGSPPSPDLSPSRLSPAHGSLARQRALRAARLGRSSDELDRSHLSSQLKRAVQVLSAAGSVPSWRSNGNAISRRREAGLEILSSLQLTCVIEGGDDHIVVATAHVRIRARWSQKAGCS